jgi:hypothetical protein
MLDRLRGETLLERQGWVRPGMLAEPIRDAIERRWVPAQLWHLLVLEHWLEKNATASVGTSAPAGEPLGVV